jgi:hypothetical protein
MSAPDLPPSSSPTSPPEGAAEVNGKATATVGEHAELMRRLRLMADEWSGDGIARSVQAAANVIERQALQIAEGAETLRVVRREIDRLAATLAERDVDLAHARTVIEKLRAVPGDYLDDLPYQAPGGYLMRDSAESISERMAAIS